jgi:hypothetical protein
MLTWANFARRYPLWLAIGGPLVAAVLMIPLRSHVANTDLALAGSRRHIGLLGLGHRRPVVANVAACQALDFDLVVDDST